MNFLKAEELSFMSLLLLWNTMPNHSNLLSRRYNWHFRRSVRYKFPWQQNLPPSLPTAVNKRHLPPSDMELSFWIAASSTKQLLTQNKTVPLPGLYFIACCDVPGVKLSSFLLIGGGIGAEIWMKGWFACMMHVLKLIPSCLPRPITALNNKRMSVAEMKIFSMVALF